MGSVKTPPSVVPSPSPDVPPRAIPNLDELYAWTSEPDHRVVIRGVDWPFYEQLVDSIPEGAFDGERKWIVIERLSEDGTYQTVDMSEFLPVRYEEVARWVLEEGRRAGSAWGRRLRAWARAELALRLPR